ncbi:MAG: hypothetical protein GY755_08735 [Chloroflexi bacterium]|nr:hypothetical protein [Chloroflexota bacterium]
MDSDPYLIPGTNTLKNNLAIRDAEKLEAAERKYTSTRAAIAQNNPVPGNLDFQHLKAIHRDLFQDVYEWAGQTRSVNIAKSTSFAPVQNIDTFAKATFDQLKTENGLQGLDRESFTERAAHYLGEINALHPFREGNGRAQRAFIDTVAARAGYSFDWSRISQKEMINASIHSFNIDSSKMASLLDKALVEPEKKRILETAYRTATEQEAIEKHPELKEVYQLASIAGAVAMEKFSNPKDAKRFIAGIEDRAMEKLVQNESLPKVVLDKEKPVASKIQRSTPQSEIDGYDIER